MLYLFLFLILSFFLPQTALAHSEVQVIEMTKEGFDPPSVTIDENATIIFLNRDEVSRWPASNSHPTHDLYSEFDPKKPIPPGESWPFKPKKIGSWKYHDHLFPHMRGIITVKSEENRQQENPPEETNKKTGLFYIAWDAIAKLLNNIEQIFAIKKKFQPPTSSAFLQFSSEKQMETIKQIAEEDPKNAWEYLKAVYKNENGSAGSVHDLAHLTGGLLYTSYGFKGLSQCTQEFAFGCYHGFLDKAFAKNLDYLLDAEKACLTLDAERQLTGPVASCMHGIGHGVASYYLTEDLPASLQTCKKLTKGSDYCFDGVFMEFGRNAPDSFFHQYDPLYPCNQFEDEESYAAACGRNQPVLLLNRFHMNFNEVAVTCQSSPSTPFKQSCFDALGYVVASSGNVDQIVSGCQSIADISFRARCIQGAAAEIVFQQIPGWVEKSHAVCEASPTDSQAECLDYIQNIMNDYGRR